VNREIREALDQIADSDEKGRLRPEAIIERAKGRSSPLHSCFTWDDGKAASRWRIEEARGLIRSYSVVIEQAHPVVTRAYVSLKSSRVQGGGYTPIHRILSDRELHAEMLGDALEEIADVERRYGHLRELQTVFEEARKLRRRRAKPEAMQPAV
jgi:hypothetical protein